MPDSGLASLVLIESPVLWGLRWEVEPWKVPISRATPVASRRSYTPALAQRLGHKSV